MGKKSRKRRQKIRAPKLSVHAPAPAAPAPRAPTGFPKAVEPGLPVDAAMPEAAAAPRFPPADVGGEAHPAQAARVPIAVQPLPSRLGEWALSRFSIYTVTLLIIVAFIIYARVNFSYDVVVNAFPQVNFAQDDAVYQMRLVDHAVVNWPHFLLYDAYTIFPYGSPTHFGPLFTLLVATTAEVLGLGAPSQQLVDMVGAFSPAVFAGLCAIPLYYIGKLAYNRRVGILAAVLLAMVPGQFAVRGVIGFTDHDMAALLFLLASTALLLKATLLARAVFNPEVEEPRRRRPERRTAEPPVARAPLPELADVVRGLPAAIRSPSWLACNPLGWLFVFVLVFAVFTALAGGFMWATVPTMAVLAVLVAASDSAGPLRGTLVYSTLAGMAFGGFLLVWTGAFIFEFIVLLFILLQGILDVWRGRDLRYLFLPAVVAFAVPMAFVPFFIDPGMGMQLGFYSLAQPVFLLIGLVGVVGIWAAWWLSHRLPLPRKLGFPAALVLIAAAGLAVVSVASPATMSSISGALATFTPAGGGITVAEMSSIYTDRSTGGFSLTPALQNFGLLYLLSVVGLFLLAWRTLRHKLPQEALLLVFSLLFFVAMYSQSRFAVFYAAGAALLSAVVVERGLRWVGLPKLSAGYQSKAATREDADRFLSRNGRQVGYCVALGLIVFFIALPGLNGVPQRAGDIPGVFYYTTNQYMGVDDQWYDALWWMRNSTPPLTLDYEQRYYQPPPPGERYDYPPGDYGVMSWWDYGHVITYWAHRIPNANPFQSGITGPNRTGAAYYFTATEEQEANSILTELGSRYVVSDDQMAGLQYNDKFSAMVVWANNTHPNGTAIEYYTPTVDIMGGYAYPKAEYADDFYFWWDGYRYRTPTYWQTMQARLHYFDGSGMRFTGDEVMLVTNNYYGVQDQNTGEYPSFLVKYKFESDQYLPALEHYRLVYESPSFTGGLAYLYNPSNPAVRDYNQFIWVDNYTYGNKPYYAFLDPSWAVHVVKVWELVPGAIIRGAATPGAEVSLELPVQTNAVNPSVNATTGTLEQNDRTFTYRAWATADADGTFTFVVPYPTGAMEGADYHYDVHALGPYVITAGQSTHRVNVSEEQVMGGATIQL